MKKFSVKFGTLFDMLVLAAGELTNILLGIAAFSYLARTLGPEAYGAIEFAIAIGFVFAVGVDLGTSAIGTREIVRKRALIPKLAAEIPATRLVLALIAIPLMGGSSLAMGQPAETVRLVWFFSFALLALPWQHRWLLQGLELTNWVSPARAIRMLIFALGSIALVHGPSDLSRVGMIEIAAAAGLAGYFLFVQQRQITPLKISFSRSAMQHLIREGFPLGLTQVVWSATQYLPILLVAIFIGGEAIAWFGAAHRIVMSLWTLNWLYHFNLYPVLIRNLAASPEAFQRLVRPSLKVTGWVSVGIAMLISIIGTPLCKLVFGASFAVAGSTLSVLIWILPATLLSGHARSALIAEGFQKNVLHAQMVGGAVMLVLGALLVPSHGALGAAIAMVVSSFSVWAVAHVHAIQKIAPMPGFSAIARPAIAAVITIAVAWSVRSEAWLTAGFSAIIFFILSLILDRGLIADLHWIAKMKDHVAEESS